MKVLVTGAAGFIGMHVAARLLMRGDEVIGVDNLTDYYDVRLKRDRLAVLLHNRNFHFFQYDLADTQRTRELFAAEKLQRVIHLAAQPGVRYSLVNPHAYVHSNVVAFVNILEMCRHFHVEHLVYASSSSVYGANTRMPFSIHDNVDHPVSLYAATKKANELMAHTYSHLFQLPTTGLRFFTVYGPWGRPDMAMFLFTKAIYQGQAIDVFNFGEMKRDFTYIDDIVEGVLQVADRPPVAPALLPNDGNDPASSHAPYKLYNIGNNQPVELNRLIDVLEECIGRTAIRNLVPLQPGDMPATYADVDDLMRDTGFRPSTPLEIGAQHFVDWYRSYYQASPPAFARRAA